MQLALLLPALALLARPFAEASSSLAYCATDNTGSSFSAGMFNMMQRDGLNSVELHG
jgi:cell wall integrity and stress response component